MRKTALVLALVLGLCSLGAAAQVAAGDNVLAGGAGFNWYNGDGYDSSDLYVSGEWGHFFTPNHEVGLRLNFEYYNGEGDVDHTSFGPGVFYHYNFNDSNDKLLPYIGGGFDYMYYDMDMGPFGGDDDSGYSADIEGGVKYFFTERAYWDVRGSYTYWFAPEAIDGDGEFRVMVFLGMKF